MSNSESSQRCSFVDDVTFGPTSQKDKYLRRKKYILTFQKLDFKHKN